MWFSISSTDKDFCCQISDIGLNLGFIKNKSFCLIIKRQVSLGFIKVKSFCLIIKRQVSWSEYHKIKFYMLRERERERERDYFKK